MTAIDDVATILRESDTPFHDLNEALSPEEKRRLCAPSADPEDDTPFWLFANLVSLNYLDVRATQWEHVPEHAMDWHRQVHTNPLNMILAGRKHTKTTWVLTEIMYKCQYIQGFQTLYWANTEGQVEERMTEFEEMCEENPWVDNLVTDSGESCGALKRKSFRNKSRLLTTWVEGSAEGGHVNMSVGDDPLKEVGGIPDEKIESWYTGVVEPMLNRDGIHVIVGTRKRPNDVYEILRTKNADNDQFDDLPSYNLMEYPAIREVWADKYGDRPEDVADESLYTTIEDPTLARALGIPGTEVSVLWPEGRPAKWLRRKLGAQGKPKFDREFCMVFSNVANAIIKRADIEEHCSIQAAPPWEVNPLDSPYARIVVGVDPAGPSGGDSSSYVSLGVRESGVRDIVDVYNAESINPSRFKRKLQELDERYAPSEIVIESNGMQTYVVEDAVEFDRSLPIKGANTSGRKHSWEDGIPRIAHRIANGGYQFYREDDRGHTEQLIDALTTLVMDENDRLQGHTPDPVSALYQAEKAIDVTVPTAGLSLRDDADVPDVDDQDFDAEEWRTSEIGQAVSQFREQRGGRF